MAVNLSVRLCLKSDTSANWSISTLVLLKGEMAIESDTGKFKIGDGLKTYSQLEYANMTRTEIQNLIDESISSNIELVEGEQNGQIGLSIDDKITYINVKGLGSAAYTDSTSYATSEQISDLETKVSSKAPIESPILSGIPKAPTAESGTNSTQIATTAFINKEVSDHNTSSTSHTDLRDLITGLTNRLNAIADSDDETLDQMSEIVEYIKNNKDLIDNITTSKVSVTDIVDTLTSTATNKPLSANQGKVLNDLISVLKTEFDELTDNLTSHVENTTIHVTSENKANWNDANSKKHTHDNKTILDGITAEKVSSWDSAVIHISDEIKHITSEERTKWNTVDDKVDKVAGKSLSTNDFTDELKATYDDYATSISNEVTRATEADKKLENTKESKLTKTVSGEFINVQDSVESPMLVRSIYGMSEQDTHTGKNKIEAPTSYDFTCPSIGYATIEVTKNNLKANEEYIYSVYDTNNLASKMWITINGEVKTIAKNSTFTLTDEEVSGITLIRIVLDSGLTVGTKYIGNLYAQVEIGISATDFEKFVGGIASPNPEYPQPINSIGDSGNLDLISKNKNYLEYPYVDTTKTVNGITFTDNRDGTVTVNGTATGTATFKLGYIEFPANNGSEFILNGCPSGGSGTTYMLQESDYDNLWGHMGIEYGAGRQIGNIHNSKCQIAIVIGNGAIINDLTFKPMLRLATDTDNTYVPYQGNKVTITSGLPLRGLQASSDGNVMIDNQRYWADILVKYADGTGEVIKRFRERIFDGTENWGDNTNSKGYVITRSHYDPDVKVESNAKSIALCTHYIKSANLWEDGKFGISDGTLWVGDVNFEDYGSLADFKAFLAKEKANGNPFKVLYQLATPERIPLTATELQSLEALHTFKPISNIYNSDGGYMEIKYAVSENGGILMGNDSELLNVERRVETNENDISSLDERTTLVESKVTAITDMMAILHSDIRNDASGEFINVTDSSDNGLYSIKAYGMSTQETLTGKNLFDGILQCGIYNADTTFVANSEGVYMSFSTELSAGTYTLSFSKAVDIVRFGIDSAPITSTPVNTTNHTFTIQTVGTLYVTFRDTTSNTTVWDMNNLIQLEAGSTVTSCEPYCGRIPSPNPEYPQPITGLGTPSRNLINPNTCTETNTAFTTAKIAVKPNTTYVSNYPLGGIKEYSYEVDELGLVSPSIDMWSPNIGEKIYTHTTVTATELEVTYSKEYVSDISLVQLEEGSVSTAFIPYGGASFTENVVGKNLLPYPYANTTLTSNGVTWTDNRDGSISVNGIPTANSFYTLVKYIKSVDGMMFKLFGSFINVVFEIGMYDDNKNAIYATTTSSFIFNKNEYPKCAYITVVIKRKNNNTECSGTIYPMISVGSEPTVYMPYKSNSATVTMSSQIHAIPVSTGGNVTIDGQQYIADTLEVFADGTGEIVKRNVEVIINGSIEITKTTFGGFNRYRLINVIPGNIKTLYTALICSTFSVSEHPLGANSVDNMCASYKGNGSLYIRADQFTSIDEFKTYLNSNPMTVVYALETPEHTPLTESEVQALQSLHTYKPMSNICNSEGGYQEIGYGSDMKTYIDNKFEELVSTLSSQINS